MLAISVEVDWLSLMRPIISSTLRPALTVSPTLVAAERAISLKAPFCSAIDWPIAAVASVVVAVALAIESIAETAWAVAA
ncbi:MAG: hypothetical protein K2X45_16920 [Phreatobacter sp.]|nr:hypothetical protein [Phreatobacter sp.]